MAEKMKDTERKVVIDGLISNSCCWTEADRKELEGMTDNQLKRTKESADKATENETLLAAAEKGFNDGRDEVNFNREKREWSKTTNKEPEKKDPIMTPEQQEALNYGLQKMQEDKDALIKQIVGNAEGAEVKTQFLSTKSIGELRQIASLIPEPQAQNHYGPNPTGSRKGASIDREDHLVPPDIDWVQNSAFATKRS